MKDQNAKAPKTRSGDAINPVLGSIIKVSIIVVIAALIVLIALVTYELIARNKKQTILFEDKIHITVEDFEIIIDKQGDYSTISDKKVRDIVTGLDDTDQIHFFFYYSNMEKRMNKEQIELINKISNYEPLFVVDLFVYPVAEGQEAPRSFADVLRVNEDFKELDMIPLLDQYELDKKGNILTEKDGTKVPKYKSFIVSYEKYAHISDDAGFAKESDTDKMKVILESLRTVESN